MKQSALDAIVEYYRSNEAVVGAVMVGSASRSYRDELSDCDIEVIVRDSYFSDLDIDKWLIHHGNENIECLIMPESEFSAKKDSPADIDHWPYEECIVLYDPIGYLDRELVLIAAMPDDIREARIKLHYFEFLFLARRMSRTLQRGDEINARLLAAHSVMTAVKLLFLLHYRWPPVVHWTSQNLNLLDNLPSSFKLITGQLLSQPNVLACERLISEVDRLLGQAGLPYCLARNMIANEVGGPAFRTLREKYGTL